MIPNVRYSFSCLAAAAAFSVSATNTQAAFDAFLQFTSSGAVPITQGETTDATFSGAVSLGSFNLGVENTVTVSSSTGLLAGKAKLATLVIDKYVDSASAAL